MSASPHDRSRPPAPDALRVTRFPSFDRTRLANGLDLVFLRWPQLPVVSLDLLLPAGGERGRAGLGSLHGELLDEGTTGRSALEIAAKVERLGAYLGTGSDWHTAYVGATLLSNHVDETLDLMAELARRSSFPEDELERVRRLRLAEIQRRRSQPSTLASRALARVVYAGTPFAVPLIGTEENVRELDRETILDFSRRHVGPAESTLLAVGDFEPDNLRRSVESVFGDWQANTVDAAPRTETRSLETTEVHLVDRPGSSQAQLQLGHLGLPRDHADHPQTLLLSSIFGGKFISRINLSLRERHGITYGASSRFLYRRGLGHFETRAAVATDSVGLAVREILTEMRRLQDERVTPAELRETQDYLVGTFPSTLQTVADLSRRLEVLAIHGLPDGYYDHYPASLREIGREDLLMAARRHLHPERLAIVAVGPAEELRPQLEDFGPVRVWAPE